MENVRAERAVRVDVRRPVVLVDCDGSENNGTMLDISAGGFRVKGCGSPRVGELVSLRLDRNTNFRGRIRWVLGDEAGGIFVALDA